MWHSLVCGEVREFGLVVVVVCGLLWTVLWMVRGGDDGGGSFSWWWRRSGRPGRSPGVGTSWRQAWKVSWEKEGSQARWKCLAASRNVEEGC